MAHLIASKDPEDRSNFWEYRLEYFWIEDSNVKGGEFEEVGVSPNQFKCLGGDLLKYSWCFFNICCFEMFVLYVCLYS